MSCQHAWLQVKATDTVVFQTIRGDLNDEQWRKLGGSMPAKQCALCGAVDTRRAVMIGGLAHCMGNLYLPDGRVEP